MGGGCAWYGLPGGRRRGEAGGLCAPESEGYIYPRGVRTGRSGDRHVVTIHTTTQHKQSRCVRLCIPCKPRVALTKGQKPPPADALLATPLVDLAINRAK